MNKEKEIEKLKRLIKCGYLDIDSPIIEAIENLIKENKRLIEERKEIKNMILNPCKRAEECYTDAFNYFYKEGF